MRTSRVLFSLLHFFLGLGALTLGAFFLTLSVLPFMRYLFLELFTRRFYLFSWIGCFFLFLGIVLFIAFYFVNRGQYYQVVLSPSHRTSVDKEVIRDYAIAFWNLHFPKEMIDTDVIVHSDQTIELIAKIPELPIERQEEILDLTEAKLSRILANKLGYKRDFLVTLFVK